MQKENYWIEGPWPGRLAIAPRPRGGDWLEDEVRSWRKTGLDIVVSLLTSDEVTDLDLTHEAEYCQANGIQFITFPIIDRGVPILRNITFDFVRKLDKSLADGNTIVIHCRQGIGRSALIAACLLVLSGLDPEHAFQSVSTARGSTVPETTEQREWVLTFSRSLTEIDPKNSQ